MASNIKLSSREQLIFELLRKDRVATLERIHNAVVKNELDNSVKKGSVNNSVKNLMTKVPHMGYLISRTTKIGRGHKATYRMSQIRII